MKTRNFKQMDQRAMEETYGGFAIAAFIAAMIPVTIQATATLISSIKMLDSDNGEVSTGDYKSKWSENTVKATDTKVTNFVYAY